MMVNVNEWTTQNNSASVGLAGARIRFLWCRWCLAVSSLKGASAKRLIEQAPMDRVFNGPGALWSALDPS